MIRTIADQYLAQNAGRRYPFRDDTELPDWLPDSGVLDFRCTLYGVGAGTAPEARLVNVAHVGDGNVRFTVDLYAGGVVVDTIQFLVPSDLSPEPYTAYASGDRSTGALTVTAAAIPPSTEAPPYDYEVEYLESTGRQWIDTGIVAQNGLTVEIDIYHNSGNQWLFGGRTAYHSNSFGLYQSSASGKLIHFGNNEAGISSPPARHVYRLQSNVFYIDGNIVSTLPTRSFVGDSTVYLFNLHVSPTPGVASGIGVTGKMYYAKVWLESDLMHDLVPVRVGMEGAMYDKVSRQLFRNANTAANAAPFNYGDDVAPAPGAGEYPVDIPLAATTVVCDSLKVMSLKSAHDAADALDESDPAGRDPVAALTGEIVLAEGRNAEPYLDGNRLRLDIRKGAGLGENCQAMTSSQTCDNVLFTINGERPGSDGDIRIAGESGISVTARPEEHAITIKLDGVARDRLAKECASACNGG